MGKNDTINEILKVLNASAREAYGDGPAEVLQNKRTGDGGKRYSPAASSVFVNIM